MVAPAPQALASAYFLEKSGKSLERNRFWLNRLSL